MRTRIVPRTIRFSDEDYACLERAALMKGYSNTSTWLREVAIAAATRILSGEDVRAEHQYERMVLQAVLEGAALLADFARDQGKEDLVKALKARVKPAVDKLMANKDMTP